MRVFHIRILLDSSEDIFRDIEIEESASFFELHESLIEAFGFSGLEMASFYKSNEYWDKGEEIVLMDTMKDPDQPSVRAMSEIPLHEMFRAPEDKMLYLYDFMRMWIFYVELIEIVDRKPDVTYPQVVLWVGNAPAEDSKSVESMKFDSDDGDDMYEDDYDFDDDSGYEPYDDSFEY